MARRFVAVVAAGLALTVAACGGGDGPQVPTTFSPSGVTTQLTGVVATQSGSAPQVQILDAKGRGIKGLRVRWKTGPNSGVVTNDSSLTDASGIASPGVWTLGTAAGTQTLTATADGVSPIVFTAQVAAGPVANLVRVSPDGQVATVNTTVAQPPSVRAQDTFGNPVAGVVVTFSVATGGGTITGEQQTTDQNGIATAGAWKLGTVAGQQLARATAPGATQASFSATAVAGAPVDLIKVAGDNQQGIAGLAIAIAPGVRAIDAFGNPVGGVPITFTPGPNSGTVTFGTVVTDAATGSAFVGSWILGTAATQTLVATSTSIPGKSVTFTANVVSSAFNVDVRFIGDGGTADMRQAFLNAAAKWRRMIVGHVHSIPVNRAAGLCATWLPAINETINDVVIFARIGAIDGAGKIIAQAGPCIYSTADNLPLIGVMEFDEADLTESLNNGTFGDVVLHEMGHVLGVGTMWNVGRSLLVDAGSPAPYFIGATARAAFASINTLTFSGNAVPVEGNSAPVGTRDGHWRESVFGRELMQGYVKIGGMPLSRVTVGSLQDLGYQVNLSAADPFTISSPILAGFPPTYSLMLSNDNLSSPLVGVDKQGRVVKTIPRQ